MPVFCDRSPCDQLFSTLGRCVFGDPKTGDFKILTSVLGPIPITYCPFCGTRLSNLELESTGRAIYLPES